MMVRKLKKSDAGKIAPLMLELYKKWDKIDPIDKINKSWFYSKKLPGYVKKLIGNKNKLLLVAESGSEITGYLLAEVEERKPFLQTAGYIAETFVMPGHRGEGIASALLKKALEWLRKRKIKYAFVGTHSLDKEAISFWKKKGFKEFNKFFKLKLKG